MLYKPYGRTGKNISAAAFGGMRFKNTDDIDGNAAIVFRAYQKGVNYFDTAPGYCDDKSELIIGAAVKHMRADGSREFYVATKSGEADGAKVQSLRRLNVERIAFFHIWCLLTLEGWAQRKKGGAVAAALKAKAEGLVEHVVVSSHLPGDELAAVLQEGVFEGVTMGYCAANFPYRQKALDAARVEALRGRILSSFDGFCTGCGYCLPCSQNVPIPRMMDAYNQKLLGSKDQSVIKRLRWHWGLEQKDALACSLCGTCEQRCTQKLPIRERLGEITRLVGQQKQ